VAVVKIPRGIVTDRIAVGEAPTTATLNRTGRLLFVPNTGGSSVTVINVVQGKVSSTIATQPKPVQVILGPQPMVLSESGFLQNLLPKAPVAKTPE
jgi:DNA-binding beta-propeller fold protein YncE